MGSPGPPLTLWGLSSGAHLAALAALDVRLEALVESSINFLVDAAS